jgi:hypothetical protein
MDDEGVQFPLLDGRRSTQRTSRDVFAHAAAAVDDGLSSAIHAEGAWRRAYPRHLCRLTERAAAAPAAGVAIARAGLDRIHSAFEFTHGGATSRLADAVSTQPTSPLTTRRVAGDGTPASGLAVPYRGSELRGDELLRVARDWQRRGVVESPVVTALERLVAHPEWLDASGLWFAVLGAGAEMAPTEPLLRWGADVVAVDVPSAGLWRRLEGIASRGIGRLHIPVDDGATLGADLITDAPRIRAWLQTFDHPLVLGNYAYADGATFARLSVAADAVCQALQQQRDDLSVVCLATPTDAFAVPSTVVHETRTRAGRWPAMLASGISRVSVRRLLVPSYGRTVRADNGEELGIADSLVLQQGPNYALAKRMQRWRAILTHADGAFAAIHVAPPTRTRSVLKNRFLAAAYAGASLFGIETFEPATSRTLMAALLLHDLRMHQQAPPNGDGPLAEHELTAPAVHGGLWRIAWETRTALPLAVLRGAPTLLRPAR